MNQTKTIRNRPIIQVLIATIFILMGGYTIFQARMGYVMPGIFVVIGLALLLFSSTDTIRADPAAGKLEIESRSMLRRKSTIISVADIRTIEIDSFVQHRTSNNKSSNNYRVVVKKKDGGVIPVQSNYSSNLISANQLCSALRQTLNLNDPEKPQGLIENMAGSQLEMVREGFAKQQEALTGEAGADHETAGVHWKLETRNTGAVVINHWHSADFILPDHFLYIAQKVHGSANLGGILGGLNKALFAQSMTIYGFTDFHAPGLNQGDVIDPLNQRLQADYTAYSDTVLLLDRLLNNYVINALATWAQGHPLKQGSQNQLALLVGPKGLYLAAMGLSTPERLQETTNLGVELVKSFQSGM